MEGLGARQEVQGSSCLLIRLDSEDVAAVEENNDLFTISPLRSVGSTDDASSQSPSPEPASPLRSSVIVDIPLPPDRIPEHTRGIVPYLPEPSSASPSPPETTNTGCMSWICAFDLNNPCEKEEEKKDDADLIVILKPRQENLSRSVSKKSPFRPSTPAPKWRNSPSLASSHLPKEKDYQCIFYQGLLPCFLEWMGSKHLEAPKARFLLPLDDMKTIRNFRMRRSDRLAPPLPFMLPLCSDVYDTVDTEMAVTAQAQADQKRRAPRAGQSMSLAPGAAAAVAKKTATPEHKKHSGGQVASTDLERVQVKTPGADRSALKDLPALRDSPPTKREELFVMKLKLCSVIFSFDDPTADKRGKDMKRQTLLELVDYVNTPAGQKIFTESVMGDLMAMVSANVCRALPPATDDFDPEEDEPVLEPAWPHLQVAYEFFLRFIVSSEVNAKAAKKYVDQKFCLQLVELFDSEDPRERDYLKTILHRIYGKFMSHRSFIRRAISNVFYRFVYETERHNGIGELLEILGSIINGFAIPLKKEHLQFLVRALIPLHKPKCVALYHQQLSYCIIQYVEKDADTATPILNGFFKCWPWSCSGKQVMFLNELEEILELLGADQLAQVSTMLFTNLARCLDSDHFQVVERALFLWNNEHLVNSGCLSRLNAQTVLPLIYGPLYKNSSGHWNATVEGLAQNVLKMYMEYDLALYDKCTSTHFREEEEAKKKLEALNAKWHTIEKVVASKQPALLVSKS